ncbi:MAG: hypothetical protein EA380_06590 [Phycisphaeraceae bacterium]|nr:MAG: hypothetical protein EA380_06590 [Phycisphaeraceae bacterium]
MTRARSTDAPAARAAPARSRRAAPPPSRDPSERPARPRPGPVSPPPGSCPRRTDTRSSRPDRHPHRQSSARSDHTETSTSPGLLRIGDQAYPFFKASS